MEKTVILDGARTPFGKFGGSLSSFTASDLGGLAIKEALRRAKIEPGEVEELIMGNVLQGGQGQIPSRQAGRNAGLPWDVRTETINKVCASGMRSVTMADQVIRANDAELIVAGGMESMSNAPYFIPKARWGARMGNSELVDLMVHDGLTCSFHHVHMGKYGNETAQEFNITREEQDAWASRSHKRAIKAMDEGRMAQEIVPVRLKKNLAVGEDEPPRRDSTREKLSELKPVFGETITAGNAPSVNDGATALVLMAEDRATREEKDILAKIVGHTEIAMEPEHFPKAPGMVINKLLEKTGKKRDDIHLFEINEAFAAVALVSLRMANIDRRKVNVNGGSVALGHPIGASGTRIILTLAKELKRRGGGLGVAAICSGGGQGDAIMIEV